MGKKNGEKRVEKREGEGGKKGQKGGRGIAEEEKGVAKGRTREEQEWNKENSGEEHGELRRGTRRIQERKEEKTGEEKEKTGEKRELEKKENEKKRKREKKENGRNKKQDNQHPPPSPPKKNEKLPTLCAVLGVFTLLMNLHDCVADPVHTVHILCDAHNTTLLTTLRRVACVSFRIPQKRTVLVYSGNVENGKDAVSVLIRDN